MAFTYALLVDRVEKFTGTFPDAHSLAADAVARACMFGSHSVEVEDLVEDVERGFQTIDLSIARPTLKVRVNPA